MKIYFAGNFPQMKNRGQEEKMKDFVLGVSSEYKRLASFYFSDAVEKSIIDIKRKDWLENNELPWEGWR